MSTMVDWLHVWIRPAQVIRYYLNHTNPTRNMHIISIIGGIIAVLGEASARSLGEDYPLLWIFLAAIPLGIATGLLMLYGLGYLLTISGKMFGGVGSRNDMLVVMTRAFHVPIIVIGLLWIPQLLLFGQEMFTDETPRIDASPVLTAIYYAIGTLELILNVWAIWVFIVAYAEAHRLRVLKAFISAAIPFAILSIALIGIHFVANIIHLEWLIRSGPLTPDEIMLEEMKAE